MSFNQELDVRYLLLSFLVSACDFAGESPADKEDENNNRVIDLPAFAVEPFDYVASNTSQSAGLFVTPISCEQQMKKLNETSEKVQTVGKENGVEEDNLEMAKALAAYSYALGLFYDCNMRQQAQDDGAEEIANDQQKVQYRAASLTDPRWDLTRFVDWFEYKNNEGIVSRTDGEADRVDGKMINLYLQEDGARTQTRIDLVKNANLRQITTIFWSERDNKQTVLKSHVVEYSKGSTKEQLLSLRYYSDNNDSNKSGWVLAHMKTSGSVIITNTCPATSDYNSACDTNATDDNSYHLDENYQRVAEHQDFKASRADFLNDVATNWNYGNYSTDAINPLTPFFAGNGNTETNRQTVMSDGLPNQ